MRRAAAALALLVLCGQARTAGFRWRGVLEGFYGRPWTWEQRSRMVDWMARHGDNLFVIAPKDDPLLRKDWREPLTDAYLSQLARLQKRAKAEGVALAWSLSPLGARLDDATEAAAAAAKFRAVLRLGLRKLVIAFDDTDPDPRQVDFADRVLRGLAPEFPDLEMTVVPALYWSKAAPSKYFDAVAERLDPRFLVAWTGPGIIPETITNEEGRRFRAYIRHKLVLGDNYPVQDRLVDAGPLYLGPLLGRDAGLVDSQEAFVSNASPLAEASKLPLATAADFARDPARYDPERSWHGAIKELGGPEGAHWLELLARECSTSWISDPAPVWIRRDTIGAAIERDWFDRGSAPLRSRLQEIESLPLKLKPALRANPGLYDELAPWVDKLSAQAHFAGGALRSSRQNPAIVADLALDRFPTGRRGAADLRETLAAFDGGLAQALSVRGTLGDLGALAGLFPPSEDRGWPGGLLPWFHILGMSAQRALAYTLVSRKAPFVPDQWWRWRMRMRMVPLITTRALLDHHFDLVESSWISAPPPAAKMGWLGLWLWAEGWVRHRAFPVTLKGRLERYRATRDSKELDELFGYLEGLPGRARAAAGPRLPPEVEPWLFKVGEYGRVGRKSLALDRLVRSGGRISDKQRQEWERDRERLRSSNGLELAARLKYRLDAFVTWRRLPQAQRPKQFRVEWPADPGDLF
ncbi:MAG: beta-N-acetylglucosaminidase domain-containing protein [Elusimicrobia bacterium]|nr:beta-N-acetylglucosaminidase domain-containing protein [Elusimicrobiota bacterium]